MSANSQSKSAEELANDYEKDGGPEFVKGGGKRTKAEQAEHKHVGGDDTRKMVQNAQNGEAKRKEHNIGK